MIVFQLKNTLSIFLLTLFLLCGWHSIKAQDLDHEVTQLESQLAAQRMEWEVLKLKWVREQLEQHGMPRVRKGTRLKWYDGFVLEYVKKFRQARWVAHLILPEIKIYNDQNVNQFYEDPSVDPLLTLSLYQEEKPAYDRGQMAPAADLRWSPKAVRASANLPNVSPQRETLNRFLWHDMETMLRRYVQYYDATLMVITGPVFTGTGSSNNLGALEHQGLQEEQVTIPNEYFKVVVDLERARGIGFLIAQDAPVPSKPSEIRKELIKTIRTIDDLEVYAGLNFFADLDPQLQTKVEAQMAPHLWMVDAPLSEFDLPVVVPQDSAVITADKAIERVAGFEGNQQMAARVMGRVVSGTRENGTIVLELDQAHPNNRCYVQIDESNLNQFSLEPDKELRGLVVEFNGNLQKVGDQGAVRARLIIDKEDDLRILTK